MTRRSRIAVVGSANVDLTTFSDRFPKAGETIFGERFDLGWGGKGANQAVAARLCGADVSMVARVGDDLFGPATIANFASQGIEASQVKVVPGTSSGVAPIFVESNGQNRIIVVKGANDRLLPADVDAALPVLETADCIVLQFEIPLETVVHTVRFAKSRGIRCIVNPAPAQPIDLALLAGVDYFVPNETEAEAIAGMPVRSIDDAKACAAHMLGKGLQRVIITLGEKGALVANAGGTEHVPAYTVATKDTTGAGDAFVGSFAVFLGEGLAERDAIARANLYAALSTMRVGTQKSFVTREQFDAEWRTRAAEGPLVAP
jgi:ribokinase